MTKLSKIITTFKSVFKQIKPCNRTGLVLEVCSLQSYCLLIISSTLIHRYDKVLLRGVTSDAQLRERTFIRSCLFGLDISLMPWLPRGRAPNARRRKFVMADAFCNFDVHSAPYSALPAITSEQNVRFLYPRGYRNRCRRHQSKLARVPGRQVIF